MIKNQDLIFGYQRELVSKKLPNQQQLFILGKSLEHKMKVGNDKLAIQVSQGLLNLFPLLQLYLAS